MTGIGDAFSWPFADRDWASKMVVQGLIAFIPIIGSMALLGWVLMTVDNYRAGRRELPPAGFHLERGVVLWVVLFVYVLVLGLPGGIVNGAGGGMAEATGNGNPLAPIGALLYLAAFVLLIFLAPSIFLNTYRAGFAGGFDVAAVWHVATTETSPTVLAAVIFLVANVIGVLGFFVCCVGLLFTLPYSGAIVAGALTWYERELAGPAPQPPASA